MLLVIIFCTGLQEGGMGLSAAQSMGGKKLPVLFKPPKELHFAKNASFNAKTTNQLLGCC